MVAGELRAEASAAACSRRSRRPAPSALANMNTIHNAVERRNYLQFDILVAQKVGLNKPDAKGLTPLMKCCHEPNKKNATEMVRLLLRQGADIELLDRRGRNVLMHAALVGNARLVELLLAEGDYDPAARDHYGNAAIHYAAMSANVDTIEAVTDFMRASRLKADLRNDDGFTPLLIACSQGHVLAARHLRASGGCSLILRDGRQRRNAREWLDHALLMPDYCDPFGRLFDPADFRRRRDGGAEDDGDAEGDVDDDASVRLFVFMKESPEPPRDDDDDDDDDLLPSPPTVADRPPWDPSTNVHSPSRRRYRGLSAGSAQQRQQQPPPPQRPWSSASTQRFRSATADSRPVSALSTHSAPPPCKHFRGRPTLLPFRRSPTHDEVQSWRTAEDARAALGGAASGGTERCYESVRDLVVNEAAPELRRAVQRIYGVD